MAKTQNSERYRRIRRSAVDQAAWMIERDAREKRKRERHKKVIPTETFLAERLRIFREGKHGKH